MFRFCPDCGQAQPAVEAPERVLVQVCPACGAEHFRNAKLAAGALVVRDGWVLLGRRARDPGMGRWDIPGGFLAPWEHPRDGARREVAEETGLLIETGDVIAVTLDTYAGRHYVVNVYYGAVILGGEERPGDDLAELAWFAPGALPTDLAFDNCREALQAWRRLSEGAAGS